MTRHPVHWVLSMIALLSCVAIAEIGMMFWAMIRNRNWNLDRFAILTASVGVSYMVLMVMANQVLGIKGIIVWAFLSLSLASRWYYEQALTAR